MPVNIDVQSAQISASTTSARTAYPLGNTNAVTIHNLGSVHIHVESGDSTVVATGNDMFVPPTQSRTFYKNPQDTHLAALASSGTATVLFYEDSI